MNEADKRRSEAKRRLAARLTQVPEGNFDASHLADIHRHLFAGLTAGAGQYRQSERGFAGHEAIPASQLPKRLGQFCGRLCKFNFLQGQTRSQAVATLAETYAGLLKLAPFEKGMELSALVFTRGLAIQGGLDFDCKAMAGQGKTLEFAASQYLAGSPEMLEEAFSQAIGQAEWTQNYDRRPTAGAAVTPVLNEKHGAAPNEALRKKNTLFESKIRRGVEGLGVELDEPRLRRLMKTLAPEVDSLLPYEAKLEERLRFELKDEILQKDRGNSYDNGIDFDMG